MVRTRSSMMIHRSSLVQCLATSAREYCPSHTRIAQHKHTHARKMHAPCPRTATNTEASQLDRAGRKGTTTRACTVLGAHPPITGEGGGGGGVRTHTVGRGPFTRLDGRCRGATTVFPSSSRSTTSSLCGHTKPQTEGHMRATGSRACPETKRGGARKDSQIHDVRVAYRRLTPV